MYTVHPAILAVPALPQPAALAAAAPALGPCRACGRAYPEGQLSCPHDGSVLPLEGRLLDGKFRLDHKVGDGGMASVWQATNTFVHRTVAIKLMHARYASDKELLGRFRNEASAAGRIGSPHICDVLDFGASEIGPYIVLELLEGCSLAELIHAHRRLDPGLAVWIVRQALVGLEAAHRVGIVHRDLKPENIFLCRAIRGQWLVKLMDFGISKFSHDAHTAAGATMGTPHYMAPEQIQRAASVDARADLWSIGVILYEAITGVQLFARENVADALAALRGYEPPPLLHHAPEAPRGLGEVLARCLQREPSARPPSAAALLAALEPFEQAGSRLSLGTDEGPRERAAATLARASAVPRSLAERLPPPSPARAPSGAHPPVTARAPSGAHPPVDLKRSSPQLPAPKRPGSLPVPKDSKRTGPQAPVSGDIKRTGPQGVVGGSQAPVPKDSKRTGPQPPVPGDVPRGGPQARARPPLRPAPVLAPHAAVPQQGQRAWLWGLLLALLGGILVLVVALTRG